MRWQTESHKGKVKRLGEWHDWYAWFPVVVKTNGVNHWVWREYIWRKSTLHDCYMDDYWIHEYSDNGPGRPE